VHQSRVEAVVLFSMEISSIVWPTNFTIKVYRSIGGESTSATMLPTCLTGFREDRVLIKLKYLQFGGTNFHVMLRMTILETMSGTCHTCTTYNVGHYGKWVFNGYIY